MEYSLMASLKPSYGVFILVEPITSPSGLKVAGQDFSNSLKMVVFCQKESNEQLRWPLNPPARQLSLALIGPNL